MDLNLRGRAASLLVCLILTYTTCLTVQAAEGDLDIRWRFDQEFFPSYIIAASTRKQPQKTAPNFIGDFFGSIGFLVVSPSDNARVRLELAIDHISDPSYIEATLPRAGERYFLSPKIKYRYAVLPRIRQPLTVNVTVAFFVDGIKVSEQTQSARVRAINDAPFARVTKDGKIYDYSWIFAAYVNENHPWIDQVLRGALDIPVPIVREFVGYQRGPQDVVNQVFAIWYYFQRRGFTYSSITTPTGYTEGVQSQYVRSLEDSLKTSQSNCIDGAVLFASILRKIGIDPFIVLVPGHAFLGFYLDPQHHSVAYLETTAMNTQLNPYHQKRPSQFRDNMARTFQIDTKLQPAAQSFNFALAEGRVKYASAQQGLKSGSPRYRIIDIANARREEINPINR